LDSIAVSSDGNTVYAVARDSSTVSVFSRMSPDGKLSWGGCFSNDSSGGRCGDVPGISTPLAGVNSIAVSPDGSSVYAGSSSGGTVSVFNRAIPGGQITWVECFGNDSSINGCAGDVPGTGTPLAGAVSIAISSDSKSVYVAAGSLSNGITSFKRAPDGRLSFGGCIGDNIFGGLCIDVPGAPMTGLSSIAISPDGSSVYSADLTADTVARFLRKTALPETAIDSGPAEGSKILEPRPRFTFSANQPGASFECSIDPNGAFGPCDSPIVLGPLAVGPHTFAVRAITDGDVDPTPATRSFSIGPPDKGKSPDKGKTGPREVDPNGPTVKLTKKPRRKLKIAGRRVKVKFAFVSSKAGSTFFCKLDKKPYAPCRSPKAYKVKLGKHKFSVQAVDAAGSAGPPASASFKVGRRL
jgi:DNA-binding beta-propeller fold protein YncE